MVCLKPTAHPHTLLRMAQNISCVVLVSINQPKNVTLVIQCIVLTKYQTTIGVKPFMNGLVSSVGDMMD